MPLGIGCMVVVGGAVAPAAGMLGPTPSEGRQSISVGVLVLVLVRPAPESMGRVIRLRTLPCVMNGRLKLAQVIWEDIIEPSSHSRDG